MTVSGVFASATDLDVAIRLCFLPQPISRGIIVHTECNIATTGARIEVLAIGAKVKAKTGPSRIPTKYELTEQPKVGIKFAPSVKFETKGHKAELQLGEASTETLSSATSSTESAEDVLAVTHVSDNRLRWSLRPHRGKKLVVDYLEGNLTLNAGANWGRSAEPKFVVTAQPTDIRFFGPSGRTLGHLASVGLRVKLLLAGKKLPNVNGAHCELHVSPRR